MDLMNIEKTNCAGKRFNELSETEMMEIVGGVEAGTRATPAVSILTKLTVAYCLSALSGLLTYAVC